MKSKVIAALGAALLVGTPSAGAAPITYVFSGVFSWIEDPGNVLVGSGIELGTAFSGTVTWDPDTLPLNTGPSPFDGTYSTYPENSTFRISVLVGGALNFVSDTAYATMGNDEVQNLGDSFGISSTNPLAFDAPLIGPVGFGFGAYDLSASVFSTSESLPTSLDLLEFDSVSFTIGSGNYDSDNYWAYGDIRFLALPTSVPEPGTLALLALGLAGIGVGRRRIAA